MLARTFSRPRWAMPSTASVVPAWAPCSRTVSRTTMVDSAPSRPKRFCPTYRVCRKRSKASAAFRRSRMWRCSTGSRVLSHALGVLLDPPLLLGVLDVHVLDAQGAAVGVAQDVERLAQGERVAARQPVDHELAVEVPQREPVGGRVELGVQRARLGRERVEVRDQMAAHPVHVDQALDVHLLHQPQLLAVAGVDVGLPLHRLVRDVHRRVHRLVEAVLAR